MKSQKTIEREKQKLCAEKLAGHLMACPACKEEKYIVFRYKYAVLDEYGDIQILLPEIGILDKFVWDICKCGKVNQYEFPVDKY
jgi:hypothetical protein